jgi:hypothetical protein
MYTDRSPLEMLLSFAICFGSGMLAMLCLNAYRVSVVKATLRDVADGKEVK